MAAGVANDVQFVRRLRGVEEDEGAYRYIRDKIRFEIEARWAGSGEEEEIVTSSGCEEEVLKRRKVGAHTEVVKK